MPALGPLTLQHPLADGIPPAWVSAWGEDDYGPWVEIHVADARQSLRWIPPGTFLMGSPDSENGLNSIEGPQQPVTISHGFWLFDTPCTQALWQAVMGTDPSHFKGAQRPVESVSWEDCQRFIDALNSALPDLRLALPTEAEWEYACRATQQTSTDIGDLTIDGKDHVKGLEDIAWYQANSEDETHPVGELQPNDFGLFDMLGNVWEWCRDNAYRKYEPDHVTDPVHRVGDSSAFRVIRGGGWDAPAQIVRAAYRYGYPPGLRVISLGFRCSSSGK